MDPNGLKRIPWGDVLPFLDFTSRESILRFRTGVLNELVVYRGESIVPTCLIILKPSVTVSNPTSTPVYNNGDVPG